MRITSLRIVQALSDLCGIKTPTVVVFFAAPFCPHNTLKRELPDEAAVIAELEKSRRNLPRRAEKRLNCSSFSPA